MQRVQQSLCVVLWIPCGAETFTLLTKQSCSLFMLMQFVDMRPTFIQDIASVVHLCALIVSANELLPSRTNGKGNEHKVQI